MTTRPRTIALLAALTMLLAACGQSEPAAVGDVAAELPPATGETPPGAAGACLEGTPDCNDTPQLGGEDLPPPDLSDEPAPAPGAEGTLTVSDALESGTLSGASVTGFLVIDESGARLCEALAESMPPQCAGASIPVTGYEERVDVPLISEQGVSWTDDLVALDGEIVDGTLVVG